MKNDPVENGDDRMPKAYRKALNDLIAEGILVVVEELDPSTGKLRKRYCHNAFAPWAN